MVANAGVNLNAGFLEEDGARWSNAWDTLTDVNVKGTAATLRATVPAMAARGTGRAILIASTFGRQGNTSNPAYIASKWATMGMMKALAIERQKRRDRQCRGPDSRSDRLWRPANAGAD